MCYSFIEINRRINMTNFQVYKKTLAFSFIQFGVSVISVALLVGSAVLGYIIADNGTDSRAFIGLGIGLLIGIAFVFFISYFVANRVKAAQVGMMTIGVADNKLPDHVVKAGFGELKGRFSKITGFFIVTNLIKGAFRQIGRTMNKLGTAIGGDTGNAITSVIDSAIQILIGYLVDCCLGWVMYRKDQGVIVTAAEGAVIFFKSGKTFFRNVGRIFGMGIASFLLIGGAFFGIFFLIFSQFPALFETLSNEIVEFATRTEWTDMPEWIHNPTILMIVLCAFAAIILWSMVHSVVGRPFVLVGVLRNFVAAAQKEKPTEEDMKSLERKSPKFSKLLHKEM